VLRRALEQARKDELVIRNVASLVDPPRVRRREVQPLTVEEAALLLDAVREDRLFALYAVALGEGLRRGEALGLRWSDIDLENDTLRVSVSLQRSDGELQLTEPKTARSKRTVPLPGACVEALTEHRQRQKQEEAAAPVWLNDWNLVFTTTIGTPLDPQNVLHQFQAVCERVGLPRLRFHDLRHTCASLLLAQGVEARVIMDTLGHSLIGTTLNLYAHVMPATQRDAAGKMDSLFRRSLGYSVGYTSRPDERPEDSGSGQKGPLTCGDAQRARRDSNPQPSDP
jgi:integrase